MHKTCSINYGHLTDLPKKPKTLITIDLNKKIRLIKYLLTTFIFSFLFNLYLCLFCIKTSIYTYLLPYERKPPWISISPVFIPTASCPACRTTLIATRFWVVMICPIIKCLTVLEFSFILFDLCLFITIFNFILNYVPIVTFWIFTYHKIWILLIIFCFIWSYWIIYFLTCLEVFWSVVS